MKNLFKICIIVLLTLIVNQSIYAAPTKGSEAKVESSSTKEAIRKSPIKHKSFTTLLNLSEPQTSTTEKTSSSNISALSTTENLGPNLIQNPSFETTNSSGNPTNWGRGGYGTNVRELIYPVTGNGDAKAAQINIKSYTSGDAKWFFDDVSVTPGKVYQFTDYSKSNIGSIITIRYKLSDGSFIYKDVANITPSSTFQKNTINITIPANVVSLTIFHLINKVGSLTVDTYSLNEVISTPTPSNLVPNGDFESGNPTDWKTGGWGTNSRQFTYPVTGVNNSKAVKVNISSYTSGDAKWYFNPINLAAGTYKYSDYYSSNIPSIITVQYENIDGSFTYKDIATLSSSNSLTQSNATFSVGNNVKSVTVFHLIEGIGTLIIDNVSIIKSADATGVFTTGAVSLRFDDGWTSQYINAIPKMNQNGIKGTFYIVSHQVADYGFTDYMSISQVKQLYSMGNEIGGHTRTHPALSTLTVTEQQNEISGGRSDLLSWNVGPILSFAYPFGDYSATTIDIVKNAGFQSGLSTIDGNVTPTSDKFQLERQQPLVNTSFAEVKSWIDDAISKKQWLILTFHQINNTGELYSITPELFNQIIDYLISKKVSIMTVSDVMKSIQ